MKKPTHKRSVPLVVVKKLELAEKLVRFFASQDKVASLGYAQLLAIEDIVERKMTRDYEDIVERKMTRD